MAPTVTTAATTTASQSATQSEAKATFTRTDAAYDGTSAPMISMIEGREFRAVAPVEGKSLSELKRLVKGGKVSWTLSRGKGQFSKKTYPNQWLGGKLSDWKTVATKDGAAEGGNGITTDEKVRKSRDFLYDVRVSAQEVDGTPSIVLTFKNRELYEGLDGIDVRSREFVRARPCTTTWAPTSSPATSTARRLPRLRRDAVSYDVFAARRPTSTRSSPSSPRRPRPTACMPRSAPSAPPPRAARCARSSFPSRSPTSTTTRPSSSGCAEDPASVQADLAAGKLSYKVPSSTATSTRTRSLASDAVMQFARDLVANKPVDTVAPPASPPGNGKAELKTEMDHDRTVWSDLIKDDVQGIGYIRGDGGKGHGTNYDGADTPDTASST